MSSGGTLSGAVDLTGGSLSLGGATSAASLSQTIHAPLSGSGTLTVTEAATFVTFDGPLYETGTGVTLLEGVSTFSANYGPPAPNFDFDLDGGRVLENQGTFTWTSDGFDLGYGAGGGTTQNDAGATFDIPTGSSILNGYGANTVTNAGTFEQTVTTGKTDIQTSFTNTGVLSVQTGTPEIDGAFTDSGSGTIDVADGVTLILDRGGSAPMGAFNIAPGGQVIFDGAPFLTTITLTTGRDAITQSNVLIDAATKTLSVGDVITPGGANNKLAPTGGGTFDLALPTLLSGVPVVIATEAAGKTLPTITLRNGLNVNLTLSTGTGTGSGAKIIGAKDDSVINLGGGTETVTLGATMETVNGGAGKDTYLAELDRGRRPGVLMRKLQDQTDWPGSDPGDPPESITGERQAEFGKFARNCIRFNV